MIATSHTEITVVGRALREKEVRYTYSWTIAYIRMHRLHLQLQLDAVLESISHLATGLARIGFGAVRERARSGSGAIGTLMTRITSWEILRESFSLFFSPPLSLSFSSLCIYFCFFSVLMPRRISMSRREYCSFARCSSPSPSPSSEIRGSHVTLHRPDLDKEGKESIVDI